MVNTTNSLVVNNTSAIKDILTTLNNVELFSAIRNQGYINIAANVEIDPDKGPSRMLGLDTTKYPKTRSKGYNVGQNGENVLVDVYEKCQLSGAFGDIIMLMVFLIFGTVENKINIYKSTTTTRWWLVHLGICDINCHAPTVTSGRLVDNRNSGLPRYTSFDATYPFFRTEVGFSVVNTTDSALNSKLESATINLLDQIKDFAEYIKGLGMSEVIFGSSKDCTADELLKYITGNTEIMSSIAVEGITYKHVYGSPPSYLSAAEPNVLYCNDAWFVTSFSGRIGLNGNRDDYPYLKSSDPYGYMTSQTKNGAKLLQTYNLAASVLVDLDKYSLSTKNSLKNGTSVQAMSIKNLYNSINKTDNNSKISISDFIFDTLHGSAKDMVEYYKTHDITGGLKDANPGIQSALTTLDEQLPKIEIATQ